MNLLFNIFKKVFNIKRKVICHLKNLTDDTIETFNSICENKKEIYIFTVDQTTYTIKKNLEEILFTRENFEMQHTMIFNSNKITKSEYYLKDLHTSLEFNIKTTHLSITDKKITINYQVLETNNEYKYIIEMSDIK